jgi:enoyl-CoA hydratase
MSNTNDVVKVLSTDDGILHIGLNRPDQLNALSHDVLKKLNQLFVDAKSDKSVKAILLTGEGKAFCAGADIKQLATLDGPAGLTFARFGQSVFRNLELSGKPSLAAIQGYAFGGGCELAMAATMRIATKTAVFGQPEIKLGVIPGFGGTQRLSRLVGKGRALELCLTGRRFTAEEGYRWGLLNELTEPDALITRAKTILNEIVQLGPIALQSIMSVIDLGYNLSIEEAMELEATHFGLCCTTADKREGVSAFIEKRTAVFSGT